MRKDLTEVVFILDRSGSMAGLTADTIGGFNAMIEKQKKEEGEAYISTVLFNTEDEVIYDRVPVSQIEPMTDAQYQAYGGTALLDAVGGAIKHIATVHKYAREEDRPAKTIFIITTDGMENSSMIYSYGQIKSMIELEKSKYGWEFIFLGANIDAVETGARFGISANRSMNYRSDRRGERHKYRVLSEAVSSFRNSESQEEFEEAMDYCCEAIAADYNSRATGENDLDELGDFIDDRPF